MKDYSAIVTTLNRKSETGPMKAITGNDVLLSMQIAQRDCYSLDDYFTAFCALNLLNAAIKKPEWKKLLRYGFIKGYATRLWNHCIYHPVKGLEYYFAPEEDVLYFRLYGVVFSYHNVSKNTRALSAIDPATVTPIEWPGIRLQKFPVEMLDLALNRMPETFVTVLK